MDTTIVPTPPDEALEKHLERRVNKDVSDQTLKTHRYRLQHFIRWCNQEQIETLDELTVRDPTNYKHWRKEDVGLNNVTWHTQMTTFWVFIKWAANYQAVEPCLGEMIEIPKMKPDEDARDETFSRKRAEDIRSYLEKFEYASNKHALFTLL